jgi:hypothetical protein
LLRSTIRRSALAAVIAGLAALAPTQVAAAGESHSTRGDWELTYSTDFRDMGGVRPMQSSRDTNSTLRDSDDGNVRQPTVRDNVHVTSADGARDGKALAVKVQRGTYETNSGTKSGWTMGRMGLAYSQETPVRVRTRIKMSPAIGTKLAVMWWPKSEPGKANWRWEVDFAEAFGGKSLTDKWGSRQAVSQRWHADLNGDGSAKEQIIRDIEIDATQWVTYDLFILPNRMWVEINGKEAFETTDRRFIPQDAGFFTVGTALTGGRSGPHTNDTTLIDYVEIYGRR